MRYDRKMFDTNKVILYGNTDREDWIRILPSATPRPLRVEMIGITHPTADYFIEREHSDYFVLEYVLSGKGYIECDGVEYTVETDCVYLLPQGKAHKYRADKANPFEKIWINFFCGILTDVLAAYGISDRIVFEHSGCRALFEKLLQFDNNSLNEDIYLKVSEIIFQIVFALAQNVNTVQSLSTPVGRIKEALEASVYRAVTVEQLAKELHMSKSQLTREFKRAYGFSPYQYLLKRKIDVAKSLLSDTNLKICEISEKLCFSDEYNFSGVFRRKTGMCPKAFRLRAKQKGLH